MCGISGFLARGRGASPLRDELQAHRGPGDSGAYTDPSGRCELRFRRLSIIDLSCAGHQPMSNEDGTVWLVFNGEIYNFRSLRAELQSKGHTFRSATDSEVLVHLWEEHGRDMLRHLNGMFAFCIWDERTGEAFLARDHAGIKPLYVADRPEGLYFSSEAKVLSSLPGVSREIDPVALRQLLTFLWVPGERTLLKGIRKLDAGRSLAWKDGRSEEEAWWDWDQRPDHSRSAGDWAVAVRQTLLDVIERQMVSDVPLGALLSGGLDSSVIVAAMRQVEPAGELRGYTSYAPGLEAEGFAADLPYARLVARHVGVELVEEPLEPPLASLLPFLVWHCDEPLADSAVVASYLLSRRARDDGTVVLLSGQGADELYYGYRGHRAMRLRGRFPLVPRPAIRLASALYEAALARTSLAARGTPRRVGKLLRVLGATDAESVMQLADWASPALRDELFLARGDREPPYDEYLQLFARSSGATAEDRWSYVMFKTFMPALNLTYGDRTSMAASLELRVPFLDRELVEQAGRIPAALKSAGGEKGILAAAARPWLPESVLSRPKTGFGAPLRPWLAGPLHGTVQRVLLGDRLHDRGLFDRGAIRRLLGDLESGRRDVAYLVWALFTFELWARTFVDADGSAPLPPSALSE
jgi:asparagine synthase (glutamine-hydrolysing)